MAGCSVRIFRQPAMAGSIDMRRRQSVEINICQQRLDAELLTIELEKAKDLPKGSAELW